MRYILRTILILTSLFAPTSAFAQYYPPAPYPPYVNPYYPPGRGYNAGAAMQGQADVMRSYGSVLTDQEKARLTREQVNQAKIDTKRKAFDEMLYEKANTPTYTEELTAEKQQILTRMMNHPIKGEITGGKTLNTMLPYVQTLSYHGTLGPPVPISQSIVNQLNISSGGTSSVGILKAGGEVEWPLGLQGKHQKNLDKLLPQAYDGVVKGTLTPTLMKQVRTEMKAMREVLRKQCQNDEIETSTYMRALEFYNSLESSVNALERPDAKKQLSGAYSPRARNVQELVDFMTDNGLSFAPCTPGGEAAYQVTHDAFVRYARTAQSSTGFQSMHNPIPAPKK